MIIFFVLILIVGFFIFGIYKLLFHFFPSLFDNKKSYNLILAVSILLTSLGLIMFNLSSPLLDYSRIEHRIETDNSKSRNKGSIEDIKELIQENRESNKNSYESDMLNNNTEDRHLFDKLVKGKMAFNISDTMEIEKNYKAIVSITKAMNDSILFQNINRGHFEKENIKISSRVKVLLIDPSGLQNFSITSLNTEEQLVDDSTNTVWKWNIIPRRSGDHELIIRTTVKVLDELGENYKDITVFEKKIKVNSSIAISAKRFFTDNWQWLSGVCFIPLITWGFSRYTRQKKGGKNPNLIGFNKEGKHKK